MNYSIDWVFPYLRKPIKFWNVASSITFVCVGLFSKIVLEWLNKPLCYNKHILHKFIVKRPTGVPLLTVSNHDSCFDDPGLWSILQLKHLCSRHHMRWSLAAHDICFTNRIHSLFFMLGKCIPVVRGLGVYQPAMNFAVEQLTQGNWVHIFPEGKVNMDKEHLRFKWGIGRLIWEAPITPLVLPIWHAGMDNVLPNTPPYYLHFGKKITYKVGEPINLSETLAELRKNRASEMEARKAITDKIQEKMMVLKSEVQELHNKRKHS